MKKILNKYTVILSIYAIVALIICLFIHHHIPSNMPIILRATDILLIILSICGFVFTVYNLRVPIWTKIRFKRTMKGAKLQDGESEKATERVFDLFVEDPKGTVTYEVLKKVHEEIGEEARKQLEKEARKNLDSGIGKDEILRQHVK